MITFKGVVILRLADLIFRIILPHPFLSYFGWLKNAKRKRIECSSKVGFFASIANTPFRGFFNFWHGSVRENSSTPLNLKHRLKIGTIAKFDSHSPQACEDIGPQSCEKLQTFVWWGWGGEGEGEGQTFQRSWRIFPTLSTSKVERNRGKVYFVVRESVQVVRLFRIPSKIACGRRLWKAVGQSLET